MKIRKITGYLMRGKKIILSCLPLILMALTWLGVGVFSTPTANALTLAESNPIDQIKDVFGSGTVDRVEGKAKQDIGTVQRNVGKLSGQIEGATKQVQGRAKEDIGRVKNKAERDLNEVQRRSDKATSDLDDASDNLVDTVKDLFGQN